MTTFLNNKYNDNTNSVSNDNSMNNKSKDNSNSKINKNENGNTNNLELDDVDNCDKKIDNKYNEE